MKIQITISSEGQNFILNLTAENNEDKIILKAINEFRSKTKLTPLAPIKVASTEFNKDNEIMSATLTFCWDHYLASLIKNNPEATGTVH